MKVRELPPHGRITRLLVHPTGVRYGFVESREGRRVYFHEEALIDLDFDDLQVGDEVRLAVAEGNDDPRASTVAPFDDSLAPELAKDAPL